MSGRDRVVVVIVIAAGVGLAIGFAPWALSDYEDRGGIPRIDIGIDRVAIVVLGSLALSMISAVFIGDADRVRRVRGLWVLVPVVTLSISIGSVLGRPAGVGLDAVVVTSVALLVIVALGALLGYKTWAK